MKATPTRRHSNADGVGSAGAVPAVRAGFIEPMLLLQTDALPDDRRWQYELKLDGYRAIAYKRDHRVFLRSRNDRDFSARYPAIVSALAGLPEDTVIDGELVALGADGRPSFSALQHGTAGSAVVFYVFDVMVLAGRDVTGEPLHARRELLQTMVLPTLREPIRHIAPFDVSLGVLVQSVRAQGFEGLVAKRSDSAYEPGLRSGSWMKMRVNRAQPFVIGGYTQGTATFDALILGYYDGDKLLYAARTRSGFTPALRARLFERFRALRIARCPFANLPEAKSGRWGQGLTTAKMATCQWLDPVLVGRFEFVEWTADNHLRHSKFIALSDGSDPRDVRRM